MAEVVSHVSAVLDADRAQCVPHHRELGRRVARSMASAGLIAGDPLDAELGATDKDSLTAASSHPGFPDDSTVHDIELEVWIDDGPRLALSPAYLRRLHSMPWRRLAVMAERSGGGWDPTWSIEQLAAFAAATPDHERILTIWPEPSARYMDELEAALPAMLAALGTDTVELDLEGHWKSKRLVGFRALREAGARLMAICRAHADEVEVTTFPLHAEASGPGSVLGEDRLLLQTYAIAEARGESREWSGRYGPPRRALEDVRRARERVGPEVEVCAGLAAWAQGGWPGEPEEAMRVSLESARAAGVRRVRHWSSKWIVGSKRTSYGMSAIEAMRAR